MILDMNLSQLSAFHAVMTSDTLTEAAGRLGRTQPAISAAIRSLEEQLDMRLFERRGRKLVPVPEAQYLLNEASAILGQLNQLRETMRGLGDGQIGSLNVAAMPGPVSMLFPRFVANHIDGLTGIKTSMLARSSTQIAELARAQSIDFGFADAPDDPDGGGLYKSDVISGCCFAALPRKHPLAQEETVPFAALKGEPLGSLQSNHVHTRDIKQAFEAVGVGLGQEPEGEHISERRAGTVGTGQQVLCTDGIEMSEGGLSFRIVELQASFTGHFRHGRAAFGIQGQHMRLAEDKDGIL